MILEFYGMSDTHYSFIAMRLFSNNRKMLTKKEVRVPKTFSLFWGREVVSWEGKKKEKGQGILHHLSRDRVFPRWHQWQIILLLMQETRHKRHRFDPWVRKIPWRRKWHFIPVSLPAESMDRGAWQATVHGVVSSWRQLSTSSDRACVCISLPLGMNLAVWFALANGILARMMQVKTIKVLTK